MRSILEDIASSGSGKSSLELATAILNSKLLEHAATLADELLYNYAANTHTKFREHKTHEWMCNELAKVRANDPIWSSKQEIPNLPQGCIKRLLRKAELPDGVSSHKPYKAPKNEVSSEQTYQNADYACLLYTSPSPRDLSTSRMPSSA